MIISNTTPLSEIEFSLDALKQKILEITPRNAKEAPTIGISSNHNEDECTLTDTYIESIRRAGGVPYIIPFSTDPTLLVENVQRCDAIVMSGGGDLMPAWFNADPSSKMGRANTYKDLYDLTLIQAAIRFCTPVLGICRGMQLSNIVLGGTLYQDLSSEKDNIIGHQQQATRYEVWHPVEVFPTSRLAEMIKGTNKIMVNSFHHQAIKDLAPCATITAIASDGVIEGVDFYPEHNIIGVQWHPEALACHGKNPHGNIFSALVAEAQLYRRARQLHSHMITIDTHGDTPMLMEQAETTYDFTVRAERALVDLPKMQDGGLHASFMVAYVPQGVCDEKGHAAAFDLANRTLDALERSINATQDKVVLCATAEEIRQAFRNGKKAIIRGLENAYPLAQDLSRITHFAQRGVRYITLCHNGDNEVCDSAARSQGRHGGLSAFGREVVKEMNRLGILIDVSHCGSSTVRDVVALSTTPIIASHSSCRALCDHPRNLTDDEIRAIAATGGVVQLCMYSGFVLKNGKDATVLNFVDHICHAMNLVGADHIGIGTDFDGDGEVIGCRDASTVIRITMELIRRGVNEVDLRKIWGGNILRLLEGSDSLFSQIYQK